MTNSRLYGLDMFRRYAARSAQDTIIRSINPHRYACLTPGFVPRHYCSFSDPDRESLFYSSEVTELRTDLATALRAADFHGLSEGVCNHFSASLDSQRTSANEEVNHQNGEEKLFLLNPQGLLWSEITPDDLVLVDGQGRVLFSKYNHKVEATAMFIHRACHLAGNKVVLHTHQPYSTALALTQQGRLTTTLSQNAMRFHGAVNVDTHYNGFALDAAEGQRIAAACGTAKATFLMNHGVVICGDRVDHAYEDLYYLERACMHEVLALSTTSTLAPSSEKVSAFVAEQTSADRTQAVLFLKALKRKFFAY